MLLIRFTGEFNCVTRVRLTQKRPKKYRKSRTRMERQMKFERIKNPFVTTTK